MSVCDGERHFCAWMLKTESVQINNKKIIQSWSNISFLFFFWALLCNVQPAYRLHHNCSCMTTKILFGIENFTLKSWPNAMVKKNYWIFFHLIIQKQDTVKTANTARAKESGSHQSDIQWPDLQFLIIFYPIVVWNFRRGLFQLGTFFQ